MADAELGTLTGVLAQACASERCDDICRNWIADKIARLKAEERRSADTQLIHLEIEGLNGIDFYLKDEAAHPSGSLKHRLARSLLLYGLCNGRVGPDTIVVEASSGSTAVSEAYFARMLGLKFVAIIPIGTSVAKVEEIERLGGQAIQVPAADIYARAEAFAIENKACYLDQFTYAERATDWRGNNNIAESLFSQLKEEAHPIPDWVVVGAGTGGTSATIGRYIRYTKELCQRTRLCVPDPENSVFFESYAADNRDIRGETMSMIEGVGRPRVEPSFLPDIIDRMMTISDAASVAAMMWLADQLGRQFGPSTGLNMYAVFQLALEMQAAGKTGSIAMLACDPGLRYEDTFYNDDWLVSKGLDYQPLLTDLTAKFKVKT
ncbi:MAG: PLP-dependent cysteine synthase family protein [Pseudomonadota bacterium]